MEHTRQCAASSGLFDMQNNLKQRIPQIPQPIRNLKRSRIDLSTQLMHSCFIVRIMHDYDGDGTDQFSVRPEHRRCNGTRKLRIFSGGLDHVSDFSRLMDERNE